MGDRARALVAFAAVLLVAVWWSVGAPAAQACSCSHVPEDERMEAASIVIVGTPRTEAIRDGSPPTTAGEASPPPQIDYVYEFDVEFVHKGTVEDPSVVATVGGGTSCAFRLTVGQLYKLFPVRDEATDELRVGACGGNRAATAEDLQPWVPPTTAPPDTAPPTTPQGARPTIADLDIAVLPEPETTTTEEPLDELAIVIEPPSTALPAADEEDDAELATVVVDDAGGSDGRRELVAIGFGVAAAGGVGAAGLLSYRRAAAAASRG